jgi:hypothetical protein
MPKLQALPWTQILLLLILLATVANYIELRRVLTAVYDLPPRISLSTYHDQ